MLIVLNKEIGIMGGRTTACVQHNGEVISFSLKYLDRTKNDTGDSDEANEDLFREINRFLSKVDDERQQRIFNHMREIKRTLDNNQLTHEELCVVLRPQMAMLYDEISLEEIRHWMDLRSDIILPSNLRSEFNPDEDAIIFRERTYLVEDYKQLVVLSIALRLAVPIWGEFIARTQKETGTTWKEYYAFQLLAKTNLFNGFNSGSYDYPLERLRIYVEALLAKEKRNDSAILGGISSEDYPSWILALAVVRRAAIKSLSGMPNSSLAAVIHGFVTSKIKGSDNSFAGVVNEKAPSPAGNDESESSRLEGYKARQDIPAGDIAIVEFALSRYQETAQAICPGISPALIEESRAACETLMTEAIQPPQVLLAQWITSCVIPARSLMYLQKQYVVTAIGITQAVLWHRGFYELAILASATRFRTEGDDVAVADFGTRARITKEAVTELDRLFPFTRRSGRKDERMKNQAVASIEHMEKLLSAQTWKINTPRNWLLSIGQTLPDGVIRFGVPQDIKLQLAELVIQLANDAETRRVTSDAKVNGL